MLIGATVGMASAMGQRRSNQDRGFASVPWIFVLDGVGGSENGAAAAQVGLAEFLMASALQDASVTPESLLLLAHEQIKRTLDLDGRASGATTATVARLELISDQACRVALASVGDSPGWLVSENSDPVLLTRPLRSSYLDAALGRDPLVTHTATATIFGRGRIVLATDGVYGSPGKVRMEVIRDLTLSAQQCATQLVEDAVSHQGADNATAAVIDIGRTPLEDAQDALSLLEPVHGG